MDDKLKYYLEMVSRKRFYPIRKDGKLIGFITYYLCNGNIEKYINKEPYEIVDDSINGDVIYIDHLIGSYGETYAKDSLSIWFGLKEYFKKQFPHIHRIEFVDGRKDKKYISIRR